MLTVWMTVFAVAVVSALSVAFIRNTEQRKSDQLLLLLCETGERNLDYYFNSVEKSVRKLSSYVEKDLDGLEDEKLEAHMKRVEEYFDLIAHKTNGVLTYYYRIDPAVSERVKGFWYTNMDGSDFTEHEVTDITLYDTQDTTRLVWFTVPKHTGSAIWLPPYVTENLDVRVISYNVPVYFRGRFIGVIGIEIDYSMMAEQVESIHLYNSGYAFLTGGDGKLIFHPRLDIATMKEEELPPVPEGLLSDSTFTHYSYEGREKVAVWLKLTNGMRLYVCVPDQETEGEWQQLIRYVLIAAFGVAALSILLTWVFTGHITRPLKQLTEAALKTNRGDYDIKLEYEGKDEVGVLTGTFMRMTDHMKEHISDLNKRAFVDALTSVRNKGAFTKYIEDMQKKLDEGAENTEFGIGVFDCDDLKSINDLYGHDKGDVYLKAASQLICKTFQHSPVFRIGGDEFAVILRNDDFKNREALAARFEKAMEDIADGTENPWEQVRIAMGIVKYDREADHSIMDAIRRADKEMYSSKRRHKETEE